MVGFYTFVFLEPEWNWRWSIPPDSNFQKYIGACLLIGYLMAGLPGNRLQGWLGRSVLALIGFLALAYISGLQTIDVRLTSFYLDIISKVIVIAVISLKLVDSPQKAWIMLWMIVVTQGYNAFRINEQYFQDGYSLYSVMRSWGNKGDNNLYSIFTVPPMAAAFALVIHSRRNWQRALAGFIFVLQMHQLMLMESRGTQIGALFMLAMGVVLMPKNRYTVTCLALGITAGSVLAGPPVVREFMSAFESAENRDSSAASRLELWKGGMKITADYPLLGVGPYAGMIMIGNYVPDFPGGKGLHNLFFEVSTGCGVPAVILYFTFFLLPWWKITSFYWYRRKSLSPAMGAIGLAIAAGIPGYLSASMFSSGALLESPYILVATCAGGFWAWMQNPEDEDEDEDEDEAKSDLQTHTDAGVVHETAI
jgi:O-antigen ligase